ncbi:zinc finger FYVE domain-containing protein 26 [Solea senegalensis]|uniref:Zinc finger FYVE domain-containing protein 26 n=1 Tax=Solea senegalensis TaxID=28829 RepID=A0AAV6RZZ4_SOLSE|nr:zinc finger FYVE domain-containing protein 26 [Solea senegalensis]KAG7510729.1 zinc finger FYVE domain-containing protein 26 [Solea senegalensis]
MYPFNSEAETSLKDLFDYFKRCLQHGEWELASACVPQLVNSTLSENLQDIIKAIVCHPYKLKWESKGSPHKLAWFWLQVLEKWTEEKVPPSVRRELEFLLLLEELGSEGITETVLKELHLSFLNTQPDQTTANAAVESCLRTLLEKKKPRLAQCLALFLQDGSSTEDRTLQHTFVQHLLKKLRKPERKPEKVEQWVEEIYAVLAVMPWSSHRSGEQFEALCEELWAARDGPLKEERVLSSLLRPQCDALVSLYCSTALRLQRDHLLRSTPDTQVELSEAEKLSLSLCCHKDRASVWKTIYFECLSSGKHFLEQVLVTALDLIKHEEFSQLRDLLRLEFRPLSRLLLLLGWTQCRSLSSAQQLLTVLHHEQAPASDTVLQEFANILSSQLRILEWCKNNNPDISMESLLMQLHTLDHHSALYVLHSLTPLPQFEERRILDLLQQLPHKAETEDTEAISILSPGVQRNVVLFQGFCAMKYAIYALCVNAHKYSNCTSCESIQQQQQHQLSETEADQNQTTASAAGCHLQFQHYLSECQLYLEAVPAMFRLELLENIFSLLFLSTTDFTQQSQRDTNSTPNTGNINQDCSSDTKNTNVESGAKITTEETDHGIKENQKLRAGSPTASHHGHLDLGHFIQGCRGFLVDVTAMEGFLKLLKEGLEGMCVVGQQEGQEWGRALLREAEVVENLGCSVTAETFGTRLQGLSKRTAEAQWRLQIITSNQGSESVPESPLYMSAGSCVASTSSGRSKSSSLRRRRRAGRQLTERQTSIEKRNDVSTSASDGGGGPATGCVELEVCPCGGPHSWLVPAMLSPPESLLMSCIRRGNFMEARQVSLVFDLATSPYCGELVFMERYKEVLVELGQVEQKMESQSMSSSSSSSEGLGSATVSGTGRVRLGSSGRSTLQAIGSAAAAGVAFYSISDIADRLLSTSAHPMPSLEEGYWLSCCSSDPSGLLFNLLEELSPAAMAAFDLACCHCQLWKTSRQLLDTAERRLHNSLETRGVRVDPKVPHSEGICGFPMVLQQISKILNHFATNKGSVKTEAVMEDQVFASPFGCCIHEVLLCCHPSLTEESIAARLSLAQRLETTLQVLSSATEGTEGRIGSSLLALLVEQANLKQSELDAHPVRTNMKQLLRSLDQLCPFEPDGDLARPDYVRSFLDYINTLASVLVRSLASEDHNSEVKLGNPLLVLLQTPFQLLSHLLFDRQVSPDRVLSLLQQESLRLSVQQVIVQRCCESLPLWFSCPSTEIDSNQAKKDDGVFSVASLSSLLQHHAQEHMSTLGITETVSGTQSDASSDSEASVEDHSATTTTLSTSPPSHSSSSSPNSFLLTPSALSFLKSRSPLLATLVCLSACKGETARTQSSGWSGYFRSGRKEVVLDGEQISREADNLLKGFPILWSYLNTMAEPVLDTPLAEGEGGSTGLGAVLCGKPLVALLLSGPQDEVAQSVAAEAFQKALSSRDLARALNLLELYGQGSSQEGALRDQLLAYAALEDGAEGSGQLFRVQDANLRGRVALQALERWPLSSSLELLDFCLNDPTMETSLRKDLELKKKELDIYRWMLNLKPPLPWATWQEMRTESKTNSESMFSMMLEAKEFALCAQWVELYPVSEQLKLQLKTEHLLNLLDKGQTDEAFQLLEGLSDFAVGLDICERALDRCPGLAACHFLSDYLTLHFQRQVSPARRRHIHALHLGSKVLLTLPSAARQDYFPLLSEPLLMLEQLLMNLKVDWADMAVQTLRNLLVGQEAGFGAEDINKLLADYGCRALDFSCAPRERTRSDSVISLQDALMQCPVQDNCSLSSSRIDSQSPSASSTPTHTPSSNVTDRERDRTSAGRKRRSPAKFQPPDQPPAQKDWVPDTKQHVCMVCQRERFTMFNRRHHCRRCGRLVCQACSEHKMPVDGCPGEEVRVCDQCYTYFHPDSDDELEPAEVAGSPLVTEEALDDMLHLPEVVHQQFQLGTNPAENQLLRSEFYYEQAPSAYLCAAILSLHSDQTACGHQLILHCRSLSRKLTNPEVDACLLTDVMRQLLFSAKLMFVKVGRNQDLALCDSYISKVDVLKILVTANYKYIPSLDDILEISAVTRLRNQLLEAEYYQLAVEVSTKSGLDPGGVWQAWAMASLKGGNLFGAREKFSRCLKAPMDRNQLNLGSLLLQEIVQHLETIVRPTVSTSFGEDVLASLRELEEVVNDTVTVEKPEAQTQRGDLNQECLYYLNTYGTHLALIGFYMRHDCMTEAVTYLLNRDCPEEVFLDGVLQPSLERGRLGTLQGILEKLDPSLETCSRYLLAACQFLQRRGYFNTLYQLQQFMMDHVRAAMTCIRFFTLGASSYLQLGEQQRWLVRAKEHLRTYLQEQQGRSAGRKKPQVNSFRKMMSSSDVSRHMNTIELQLEVTRFLHRCETAASSNAPQTRTPSSKTSRSNSPPTLFGGSPVKVEVACKVMLGGKNIEEGFGIAYRVIQDFQLEAQAVYTRAGQRLVRQRQYGAVRQLLKCVSESGTATKNDCDALILSCVSVADKAPSDAKELESLILETKSTDSKIKAYLMCGKLRPAYLLAVKLEPSRAGPLVQDVLQAAEGAQDSVMQNICRQWLSEHHSKSSQQRQGRPSAR